MKTIKTKRQHVEESLQTFFDGYKSENSGTQYLSPSEVFFKNDDSQEGWHLRIPNKMNPGFYEMNIAYEWVRRNYAFVKNLQNGVKCIPELNGNRKLIQLF